MYIQESTLQWQLFAGTFWLKQVLWVPYPRKRGPMGGAPYIGPRLGDGLIFKVSVSHLDAKERPGKLPTLSS